jgi:hypothetical protein
MKIPGRHRPRDLMTRLTRAFVLVAALLVGFVVPQQAHAASAGWGQWLMPTGTICVQTGGSTYWPIAKAVAAINATDASMVAKASCRGYKRSMTVILVAYYNANDSTCASTYSKGWTWQKVRGVWTWTPNAPYIKVNFSPKLKAACQNTYRKRLYLMSHELLHVVGLAHAWGVTAMRPRVNEVYVLPTWRDVQLVNRRY